MWTPPTTPSLVATKEWVEMDIEERLRRLNATEGLPNSFKLWVGDVNPYVKLQ